MSKKKFPLAAALGLIPGIIETVKSFKKKTPERGKMIRNSGIVSAAGALGLEALRSQSPETVQAITEVVNGVPSLPDLPQNWLVALEMILGFLAALLIGKGQGEELPEAEENAKR